MDAGVTTAAVVLLTLYLTLYWLQSRKTHPDEPPIIVSGIPFAGHILGMVMQGGRYMKSIGIRHCDKPIFTIPVPGSRIYVVTDPALAAAVQRASRALSFSPLVPDVTRRVLGLDDETVAVVRQNLDPEPGAPRGFLADMHDLVYGYLGPGHELDELTLGAARALASEVGDFVDGLLLQRPTAVAAAAVIDVDLLEWVRHFVTTATARFLYGARNPIAERPELERAFWDFDHGLGMLLLGVLPSVTASRPYRSREALVAGFADYLRQGRHHLPSDSKDDEGGSAAAAEIIRRRVAVAEQYGWKVEAVARSELSFLFGGIVNTATTAFWILLHVFARPDLLAAVREEILARAIIPDNDGEDKDDNDGSGTCRLSLAAVQTDCPLLMSVFRECLRLGSDNYSTRLVKEDTVLAGRWRLSAGSVVQVAGGVIHADERIWGADADGFDADRFLVDSNGTNGTNGNSKEKRHPAAFRGFGGGRTLCPGRHFATGEILAFVAMIVLSFDAEGPAGTPIVVPTKEDGVLPVHILEPKRKVEVTLRVRNNTRRFVVV